MPLATAVLDARCYDDEKGEIVSKQILLNILLYVVIVKSILLFVDIHSKYTNRLFIYL